jgi:hypothetical protein
MAGRRDTKLLQPLDKAIFGMAASPRAAAHANAVVAPQVRSPGGRACHRAGEARSTDRPLPGTVGYSGGVEAAARCQGRVRQREQPSASHRAIDGAREVVSPATTGKSTADERVAEGSVGAEKRGKARGAKGPSCVALR